LKTTQKKKAKKNGFKRFWKLGQEEFNTQYFDITEDGDLVVKEGHHTYNVHSLLKKYGSPLEIVFPHILESRVRNLIDIFDAYIKLYGYKGKFFYHYAMKVNQNKEFVLPVVSEGGHFDVASVNELWLVKRMLEQNRFSPKIRVTCNGPKTEAYIALIEELRAKGLTIIPIIEDHNELERFKNFKGETGIRLNMNVRVQSHWDKRFNRYGFREDEILKLGKIRNLSVLHYHISSQIEKVEGLIVPLKRALYIYEKLREKNPNLDTIDMGGGAGIPYEKKGKFYTGKSAINRIVRTAKNYCEKAGIKHPNLIVEWGRFVAAPAQLTLYKIISEKTVSEEGKRKWYIIDGSFMNDLLDTWALKQKWHVTPVNNMKTRKLQRVWFAGSSCDSDDKYTAGGGDISMPRLEDLENGDSQYVAFYDTGAYQDPLASHHCLLSSPAKIICQDGEIKVARKRETSEEVGKQFGW
jgi:arginine decarboxylase